MVEAHRDLIVEEFQQLLNNDKTDGKVEETGRSLMIEDLARSFFLLARIPSGLDLLKEKFELHVKQAGLAAVEKLITGQEEMVGR